MAGDRVAGVDQVDQRRPLRLPTHLGDQPLEHAAIVEAELAPDQVGGLDAVGAFVDRGDARVAEVLRSAGLLDIAHPAMHLDAERGDFVAEVGAMRLGQRGQQVEPPARLRIAGIGAIDLAAGEVDERARRHGLGAHPEQHAADVGMFDDRDRPGTWRRGARALHTIDRIGQRALRRRFCHLHAL